ncbi:MAG: transcriptional repressor [Candidatus Celaenobacter antarcticus]|nr:transcriptional repressor [Candidatus Celaenobacter antarcticus]
MNKKIDQFKSFLKNNNSLWSSEREQITRFVLSNPDHFSADDLYLQLKQKEYTVSRATVYRTLDLLVKSGLVVKTQLESGAYLYEHVKDLAHHDHLICNKCGKIIEFHSDGIESLQEQIAKENKFHMTGHSLRIYGICRECREEKN